jgi:mannose-6-phosphate isomerase-like protein (cupin superfamily)
MEIPMMTDATVLPPVVRGPGEGRPIWFLRSRMTVKASAAETGGGFALLETRLPAGFSPPLHVHHREEESFYVLEGALTMRCGDEDVAAPAGSFVCLPRGVPHTFRVDEDARMLTFLTPGGGEGFFLAGGRRAEDDGLPPAAPPDVPALQRAAADFGMEIVGPPMPPA